MKIVVRGTNWVGDAVMTIPALREIRRIFPDAHITLCSRAWAHGIFQDAEFIDEILPFEKGDSVLKQAKIWREKKFDLAIILTNSFQSALLTKLGKVKKRFGYATEKRSIFLSNPVKVPGWKNERHEVFYYLNLVAEIEKVHFGKTNLIDNEPNCSLNISNQRRIEARKILTENGADLTKKTFALGVGSTNSRAKRWGATSYAELNDKLQSELNANVVLVGTKDELDVSNEVFASSQFKPIILTGKTSLAEAVAILAEVNLLVSNDMGLSHLAPAVGTKTLVIFGPTNDKTTRPFPKIAEIIRQDVECAPCMLRDCPIDHRCMTRISADEVFEKVKQKLDADKRRLGRFSQI